MAYFRKRGNKWSFTTDIGVDPVSGKRKQKTSSGYSTKKEAQLASSQVEQELAMGTYVSEKTATFKSFAPEWLEMYQATGRVKPSTVYLREVCIKRLLKYFSNIKLKEITKKIYQDMLIELVKVGYAKETVVSTHATAKMIFDKAVEMEIIKNNPTLRVIIPSYHKTIEELEDQNEVPKYLEKDELRHFLMVSKEHGLDRDYPAFLLLAYTGMRIGELCALKWRDIDFDEYLISITKTYWTKTNNTKNYVLLTPKTSSSKRIIVVDKKVAEVLKNLRAVQNQVKMKRISVYYDHDFVFAKMNEFYGYPEKPSIFRWRMCRLLKISKLNEKLTLHSLRHTHTSLLAEARVGLETIQERLGHKNDDITRRIYLHVTKTVKREAADKFHQLMEG